jgi:hypothetical protein
MTVLIMANTCATTIIAILRVSVIPSPRRHPLANLLSSQCHRLVMAPLVYTRNALSSNVSRVFLNRVYR